MLSTLYRSKAQALVRENIQNSVDARAKNIWITFDPARREASFIDDGEGVPIEHMNEREYFSLRWTTKRKRRGLIGSKGIGRLTNIAYAKRVTVETNDGHGRAVYTWFATASFSARRGAPRRLDHPGLALTIHQLSPDVCADFPARVDEVATDVFDHYLRAGLMVWFNGKKVKPKEYSGKRHIYPLKAGGNLEVYWSASGQTFQDQGVVLKCRGVKVGERTRFGIESGEWRNIAAILHLDDIPLTASRDAFVETAEYRAAYDEATAKMRSFIASREVGRKGRLSRLSEYNTKAALEAAKKLGIDLSLMGELTDRAGTEGLVSEGEGDGTHSPPQEPAAREPPKRGQRKEGEKPGFRLIPKNFADDADLRPVAAEMSSRRGSAIYVNLGHPACPDNRHSKSFYIWCCAFVEILRLGMFGGGRV